MQRRARRNHTPAFKAKVAIAAIKGDRTVIALWLGHESIETTQMYIHADIQLKEKAMARTQPVKAPPGRYRPDDKLLAFLEAL